MPAASDAMPYKRKLRRLVQPMPCRARHACLKKEVFLCLQMVMAGRSLCAELAGWALWHASKQNKERGKLRDMLPPLLANIA